MLLEDSRCDVFVATFVGCTCGGEWRVWHVCGHAHLKASGHRPALFPNIIIIPVLKNDNAAFPFDYHAACPGNGVRNTVQAKRPSHGTPREVCTHRAPTQRTFQERGDPCQFNKKQELLLRLGMQQISDEMGQSCWVWSVAPGGGARLLHWAYCINDCARRGALDPKVSLRMFPPTVQRAEQIPEEVSGPASEDSE